MTESGRPGSTASAREAAIRPCARWYRSAHADVDRARARSNSSGGPSARRTAAGRPSLTARAASFSGRAGERGERRGAGRRCRAGPGGAADEPGVEGAGEYGPAGVEQAEQQDQRGAAQHPAGGRSVRRRQAEAPAPGRRRQRSGAGGGGVHPAAEYRSASAYTAYRWSVRVPLRRPPRASPPP
ncbi:hypothetical protein GCM10010129_04080 [Streptomyces fumigatiscleroticus]|nr:hypothetical protein GCM10010129_04080 [Streptomyces fumigatiscleroticus]